MNCIANDHELEHQLRLTAGSIFRIQAYTAGYTRDLGTVRNLEAGIGSECHGLRDSGRDQALTTAIIRGALTFLCVFV